MTVSKKYLNGLFEPEEIDSKYDKIEYMEGRRGGKSKAAKIYTAPAMLIIDVAKSLYNKRISFMCLKFKESGDMVKYFECRKTSAEQMISGLKSRRKECKKAEGKITKCKARIDKEVSMWRKRVRRYEKKAKAHGSKK